MGTAARRVLIGALLSGVAVLAYVNWGLLSTGIDISPMTPRTPIEAATDQTADTNATPVAPLTTKDALAETLDRPLFNRTRKPDAREPESSETITSAPEDGPNALKLVGMMQWGSNRRALIRVSGEPYARWFDVGGDVDGWKLKAIERDFVVVEQDVRRREIRLAVKPEPSETGQE